MGCEIEVDPSTIQATHTHTHTDTGEHKNIPVHATFIHTHCASTDPRIPVKHSFTLTVHPQTRGSQ